MNPTKCRWALLAATLLLLQAPALRADDGGISFGGSPHLLKGHRSVSMDSEVVNIEVGKELIKVDCRFVFKNNGPACVVRMGFPDQGLGAEEPYQGEELPKTNLKATFLSYESFVDGKKVPTKLIPTNDRALFWHTKTVKFKANSVCKIRDIYTLKPGAQMTMENGLYQQTYYVLHTGASWRGPIGKAEINVNFAPEIEEKAIKVQALNDMKERDLQHLKWSQLASNVVIYEGPCRPEVNGRSLRFRKSNFEPSKKDDVKVYYAWKSVANQP